MEITDDTLLDLWEFFADYIPVGKKNDTAVKFLRVFMEHGVDIDDLKALRDEDDNIDYALDEISNSIDENYDEESDYEEE